MFRIIFNRRISTDYYKMRIFCPGIAAKATPGQFVMIRVHRFLDPFLRRPFGIHSVCGEKDSLRDKECPSCIEILYRMVGKGTLLLSEKEKDEEIDLLGPLGNGFSVDHNLTTAVLVAGGIGVAPLFFLAQALQNMKGKTTGQIKLIVFVGGETKDDILCLKEFNTLGARLKVSTNDGSVGIKGLVTDLLLDFLSNPPPSKNQSVMLFGCGPSPMLRTLSDIALSHDIPCQISLESRMACGVGACLGCAVPTVNTIREIREISYQRVCKEGPIFDSTVVLWDTPLLTSS